MTKETIPITFGHEFSGVVTEIGKGVTGFTPGQHVSIQPTIYDGTCGACIRKLENICYHGGFVGLSGWGGGLSGEYLTSQSLFPFWKAIYIDCKNLNLTITGTQISIKLKIRVRNSTDLFSLLILI